MTRLIRLAIPLWAAALALLICAPLLGSGYVLSYDMVWVPHLALGRADVWGLGSALPRAVPSDAFAGLLGAILPAYLVQKVVLLGALFLTGLGMGRLLGDAPLVARLSALTLYVWNPFVAERLVLGQWPVLIAYAGVPWLIDAVRNDDEWLRPGGILALAATALTPATGLMGVLVALACKGREKGFQILVAAAAVNAPWIVSGILHSSIAKSDGSAIGLFDVQSEGPLGRIGAALSLGGIWNADVVPTSRGLALTTAFVVVLWAVMLVGVVTLWGKDRVLLFRLGFLGAVGVALALSGWLLPGTMADLVSNVPAAGILRDGTRYLLLLAPLEAVAFGFGAQRLIDLSRTVQARQFVAVLAVVLPLIALPDLAGGVGGALKATHYPASWERARSAIEASSVPGDILVLPFSSYRRPSWNHDTPVLDPAGRFFPRETVVNDVLLVSGKAIAGEDPRAIRVATILKGPKPAKALAREGIGIVVYESAVGRIAPSRFDGMTRIQQGDGLEVYTIPKAMPRTSDDTDRFAMIAAWTIAFLALWSGATRAVLARLKR